MVILGLTGSIAMGKSTAAAMFKRLGVQVFDADKCVHALLGRGGAGVEPVATAFLGVVRNGVVDRLALASAVFNSEQELRRLEVILHPLVRASQTRFLQISARHECELVVLDVPLLFETSGDALCDRIAVVSAPERLQRQRLLARSGMTAERVNATLSRQMSDCEKRRRADFVIPSGQGRALTMRVIMKITKACRQIRPRHWPPTRTRHGVGRQRHGIR